jgi:exodeoxyribonuclease V alpha subunit
MKLKSIDRIFAQKVLEGHRCDEKCVHALSYLFASVRQGHHCINIDKNSLLPSLHQVLEEENEDFLTEENIVKGFHLLPSSIVQQGKGTLNLKPVVQDGTRYYAQKYYFLEEKIAQDLARLLKASPVLTFSDEEIIRVLSSDINRLNNEQQEAVFHSLFHPLYALTGGPGTGKTYTVSYILMTYLKLCTEHHYEPRILVAAPTGKAMALLKEKLRGQKLLEHAHLTIATLHRALKIKRREDLYGEPRLLYDLIIIDECSMIDVNIWRVLLSAIEEGSRVMIMGDHCQLPPVEAGRVFEELITLIPRSHLHISMRTEQQELLKFAETIKQGDFNRLAQIIGQSRVVRYVEYEEEYSLSSLNLSSYIEQLDTAQDAYSHCCFLSPILQGPWGVETLNQTLYEFFLSRANSTIRVPIILTQTHYDQELYNGDTGILIQHLESKEKSFQDYALFESNKRIAKALLPQYQYAYALSVHKSQGSEYDQIVLFLPERAEFFGKEVLYTAITRAKKSVTIISKKGVLKKCLTFDSKKNCALSSHIRLNGNQE